MGYYRNTWGTGIHQSSKLVYERGQTSSNPRDTRDEIRCGIGKTRIHKKRIRYRDKWDTLAIYGIRDVASFSVIMRINGNIPIFTFRDTGDMR